MLRQPHFLLSVRGNQLYIHVLLVCTLDDSIISSLKLGFSFGFLNLLNPRREPRNESSIVKESLLHRGSCGQAERRWLWCKRTGSVHGSQIKGTSAGMNIQLNSVSKDLKKKKKSICLL